MPGYLIAVAGAADLSRDVHCSPLIMHQSEKHRELYWLGCKAVVAVQSREQLITGTVGHLLVKVQNRCI